MERLKDCGNCDFKKEETFIKKGMAKPAKFCEVTSQYIYPGLTDCTWFRESFWNRIKRIREYGTG